MNRDKSSLWMSSSDFICTLYTTDDDMLVAQWRMKMLAYFICRYNTARSTKRVYHNISVHCISVFAFNSPKCALNKINRKNHHWLKWQTWQICSSELHSDHELFSPLSFILFRMRTAYRHTNTYMYIETLWSSTVKHNVQFSSCYINFGLMKSYKYCILF